MPKQSLTARALLQVDSREHVSAGLQSEEEGAQASTSHMEPGLQGDPERRVTLLASRSASMRVIEGTLPLGALPPHTLACLRAHHAQVSHAGGLCSRTGVHALERLWCR